MLTNTSATLYNWYQNRSTGQLEWHRVLLSAVHWEDDKGAAVRTSGLASADSLFVAVPFQIETGKTYLPPKEYAELTPDVVGDYWTFTEGKDTIIKGEIVTEDVLFDIKPLLKKDYVFTVSDIGFYDYGSDCMKHWEVSGK